MAVTEAQVKAGYAYAKEIYASVGVDVDKAMEKAALIPISMHCW